MFLFPLRQTRVQRARPTHTDGRPMDGWLLQQTWHTNYIPMAIEPENERTDPFEDQTIRRARLTDATRRPAERGGGLQMFVPVVRAYPIERPQYKLYKNVGFLNACGLQNELDARCQISASTCFLMHTHTVEIPSLVLLLPLIYSCCI